MSQYEPYEEFESLLDMILALCRYLALAVVAVLAAGLVGALALLWMGA
jgi:hypothetical protein